MCAYRFGAGVCVALLLSCQSTVTASGETGGPSGPELSEEQLLFSQTAEELYQPRPARGSTPNRVRVGGCRCRGAGARVSFTGGDEHSFSTPGRNCTCLPAPVAQPRRSSGGTASLGFPSGGGGGGGTTSTSAAATTNTARPLPSPVGAPRTGNGGGGSNTDIPGDGSGGGSGNTGDGGSGGGANPGPGPGGGSTLLSADLFSAGDGLLTHDTRTDLYWLDVNATLGVSYSLVQSGFGGYTGNGFRFATEAEVAGLFESGGLGTDPGGALGGDFIEEAAGFVNLLGCTNLCDSGGGSDGRQHLAIYQQDQATLGLAFLDMNAGDPGGPIAIIANETMGINALNVNAGNYLVFQSSDGLPGFDFGGGGGGGGSGGPGPDVTPVPLPAAAVLFGFALGTLLVGSRRLNT